MIKVTEKALTKMQQLLISRDKPAAGIRFSVKRKGCSGLAYMIEFADVVRNTDTSVVVDGVNLLIDDSAQMFIIGTTIDYTSSEVKSGFVFNNPNEKGRCGCGQSFYTNERSA